MRGFVGKGVRTLRGIIESAASERDDLTTRTKCKKGVGHSGSPFPAHPILEGSKESTARSSPAGKLVHDYDSRPGNRCEMRGGHALQIGLKRGKLNPWIALNGTKKVNV